MELLYNISKEKFSEKIVGIFDKTVNEMKLMDRFDEYYQEIILDDDISHQLQNDVISKYSEEDIKNLVNEIVDRVSHLAIMVTIMEYLGLFFDKVKFKVDPVINLKDYLLARELKLQKDAKNLIRAIEIFVTVYFANKKYYEPLYDSNNQFKAIYDSYPEDIKAVISDFRERKFILNKISNAESTAIKGLLIANPIGLGVFGISKIFGKKKITPLEFTNYDEFYMLIKAIRFSFE